MASLNECQPACKLLPSYAFLLQNMILLCKSELSDVKIQIIYKICKSEIPKTILANILRSDQVVIKTAGVHFFGTYVATLA